MTYQLFTNKLNESFLVHRALEDAQRDDPVDGERWQDRVALSSYEQLRTRGAVPFV